MHLTITDLALGGDGVGRLADGRTLFVPFTIPGEEVEAEIVSTHKRFARARLAAVVKPSPDRTAPHCPFFGRCGGCQYQHMTYSAQLAAKKNQLRETLARLGGFRDSLPEIAVVKSPREFGYRNKIRLEPLSSKEAAADETPQYGFHATDNETLLPVASCPIAMDSLNRLLAEANRQRDIGAASAPVRESPCPSMNVHPLSRQRQSSPTPQLTLRQPAAGDAVAFTGRPPNGAEPLVERVLGRDVLVAQDGFWQVNPGVGAELIRLVAEWAAEAPADHLVDAYGGVGVFGLAAGASCKRMTVIELDADAVRLARANFAAWGLGNAAFIAQPTERALPRLLAGNAVASSESRVPCSSPENTQHATGNTKRPAAAPDVILDPPRGGCDDTVLDALAKHPPRRLLYVSCNPATLARDLRTLTQDGAPFRLERLTLLDMFPQTAHFETMAVLARKH